MGKAKTQGDLDEGAQDLAIGIDQSYSGFAITVLSPTGAYYTMCKALDGKGVERLLQGQELVLGTLSYWGLVVPEVAMEGYAYGATQTAHMSGELGGAVKLALRSWNITPLIATPSQVKKHATGKGNAKKDEVILGVYKQWGVEFADNNMADSFVLAKIALGEGNNSHQRDVVAAVRKAREGN